MATIIKRDSAHQMPAGDALRGVAFDFEDMSGQAEQYVNSVRQEATKIVQAAKAEAATIRKQAEEAGRAAAEQAVEQVLNQKVAKQMQSIMPALDGVVAELQEARSGWLGHWEKSAVTLAAKIAGRIVRRELVESPEITIAWAREALELTAGASQITLRMNPADHANLGPQVETVANSIGKLGSTKIVADENISPGGCIVETERGMIDAQVETQLERMIEELS